MQNQSSYKTWPAWVSSEARQYFEVLAQLEAREAYLWISGIDVTALAPHESQRLHAVRCKHGNIRVDRTGMPFQDLVEALEALTAKLARLQRADASISRFEKRLTSADQKRMTTSLAAFGKMLKAGAIPFFLRDVLTAYREERPEPTVRLRDDHMNSLRAMMRLADRLKAVSTTYNEHAGALPPPLRATFALSASTLREVQALPELLQPFKPHRDRRRHSSVDKVRELEADAIVRLQEHLYATTGHHMDKAVSDVLDGLRSNRIRPAVIGKRSNRGKDEEPLTSRRIERARQRRQERESNEVGIVIRRELVRHVEDQRAASLVGFDTPSGAESPSGWAPMQSTSTSAPARRPRAGSGTIRQ